MRGVKRFLRKSSDENRDRGTFPSFQNPYSNYDLPLLRLREVESSHEPTLLAHHSRLGAAPYHQASNFASNLSEQNSIPRNQAQISGNSLDNRIAKTLENLKFAPIHQKPRLSCDVANLLFLRYCRTGAVEDLDQAIELVPRILQENSRSLGRHYIESEALRGLRRPNLKDMYFNKADAFKENQDPDTTFYDIPSIGGFQSPSNSIGRTWSSSVTGEYIDESLAVACQNNLACYLGQRYLHSGYESDIEEAISVARRVINHKHGNKSRQAGRMSNLAVLLGDKYARNESISDLKEALSYMKVAVDDTPNNDPVRATRLNNLATLMAYMEACGDAPSYDLSAVSLIQDAANLSLRFDPENTAAIFYNFARLYHESFENSGQSEDLEKALDYYFAALNHPVSLPMTRILAGRAYLSIPDCLQDANRAYEVAEACIKLISNSIQYYLKPADKLWVLSHVGEMVSDAVAVTLHVGKSAFRALELLETGRGVIISSLQNLRAEIDSLDNCDSELAEKFGKLRTKFDGSRGPLMPIEDTLLNTEHPVNGQVNRRQYNQNLSHVIEEIRKTPMFERFFSPPSEKEMKDAARKGPIVVINISIHRCDAIIIQSAGISNLPLPYLTLEEIRVRTQDTKSYAILEWLWDTIDYPVLESLNLAEPLSKNEPLPHIWWIPTGPITGFPLHAAGYHLDQSGETALDKVISSFSLSITTIVRTRQRKSSKGSAELSRGVRILATPNPQNKRPLPHAVNEANEVSNACSVLEMPCTRINSLIHNDSVQAIKSCGIFHFIGHAEVDIQNPLQTSLILTGSEITVGYMLDLNTTTEPPFLAYLSACGTSQGRDTRLADENIHLAAVFQLSGFRHAIATLWEVEDELCGDISKRVYKTFGEDGLNDESVSKALHNATRELRDLWVIDENAPLCGEVRGKRKAEADDPEQTEALWVPYVHFGV